jgi:hypothetical protein
MLQGHDISNTLLTLIRIGLNFLETWVYVNGLAEHETAAAQKKKDNINVTVLLPAHVMKAYIGNTGTAPLILNLNTSGSER